MTTKKTLMCGNEAIGEAAVFAGCRFYAGYPITPQNELPAYMAKRMYELGGTFIQSESELAAINMVFGASAAGARAMTSSSSPGVSLKQEGISYIAGCELPAVIINIMRGGPGLGNISPSQSDYFQAVKGGGHGDYKNIVLAPASVQEMFDLTVLAFDLADKYRMSAMILADGLLGQMMEPLEIKPREIKIYKKPWALTGCKGRKPNIIRSLLLEEGALEKHNNKLFEKYDSVIEKETRFEVINEDADIFIVAYGLVARIAKAVIAMAKQNNISVGLIRPITLWPFPYAAIKKTTKNAKFILAVEMSKGQMVEDVRLSVGSDVPVHFFGRAGGAVPTEEEILERILSLRGGRVQT